MMDALFDCLNFNQTASGVMLIWVLISSSEVSGIVSNAQVIKKDPILQAIFVAKKSYYFLAWYLVSRDCTFFVFTRAFLSRNG